MLEILGITGPIFIIIAVGFATVRLELVSKPDIRVLGLFVINFLAILAGSVFAIFEISSWRSLRLSCCFLPLTRYSRWRQSPLPACLC